MGWDLGGLVKVDFFVIATISIYVTVIMLVGWWSSRKVHDMTDFPAAGPGIWVPLGDDSVPPELERAARNDKLMPQPILGATL